MTGRASAHPLSAGAPVLAIVGPTGSGKSHIALRLAAELDAEIVAVDSMTIYRGLDIGTAKPSLQDREAVPHHLIDIADPSRAFNVAQFQLAARAVISSIHARGRVPLLVGGSGLYFRAVVDDLEFPPTDESVRERLAQQDPGDLLRRLESTDPEAFSRMDPANVRRIVRALEVIEITGSSFSTFRASWDEYRSRYDLRVAGVEPDRGALADAIARRTQAMLAAGLIDEVSGLLAQGFRSALTASRAIAYRHVVDHLDGQIDIEEAAKRIDAATRQYARRQMIWFRKDPRIAWFPTKLQPDSSDGIADAVAAHLLDRPVAGGHSGDGRE